MNLTDIINAVYVETGRPDLVDETLAKVVSTTLALHLNNFYLKDIQSARVGFDYASYLQQLDTMSLPLYRKMAWIRRSDSNVFNPTQIQPPTAGQLPPLYPYWFNRQDRSLLKCIDGDDIFNLMGFEKSDVWYQAGSQINMKSSWAFQYAQIAWYQRPNLDTSNNGANFSSWIADDYPYAIIYIAAGGLLRSQGQQDDALQYTNSSPRRDGGMGTGIGDMQALLIDRNEQIAEGF